MQQQQHVTSWQTTVEWVYVVEQTRLTVVRIGAINARRLSQLMPQRCLDHDEGTSFAPRQPGVLQYIPAC